MNPWRASYGKMCLALLTSSVMYLGFACESEPEVRDPRCAKHPPPAAFGAISTRVLWTVYYDIPSGECVTFNVPWEGTIKASGAKDFGDFKERFTPFLNIEECM